MLSVDLFNVTALFVFCKYQNIVELYTNLGHIISELVQLKLKGKCVWLFCSSNLNVQNLTAVKEMLKSRTVKIRKKNH